MFSLYVCVEYIWIAFENVICLSLHPRCVRKSLFQQNQSIFNHLFQWKCVLLSPTDYFSNSLVRAAAFLFYDNYWDHCIFRRKTISFRVQPVSSCVLLDHANGPFIDRLPSTIFHRFIAIFCVFYLPRQNGAIFLCDLILFSFGL